MTKWLTTAASSIFPSSWSSCLSFLHSPLFFWLWLWGLFLALYFQFVSPLINLALPATGCMYFFHRFLSWSGPLLQYSNTSEGKSSVCITSLPELTLQAITHHTQHLPRAILTCFPNNLITSPVSFSSRLTGNAAAAAGFKFMFPQPFFCLALHPT